MMTLHRNSKLAWKSMFLAMDLNLIVLIPIAAFWIMLRKEARVSTFRRNIVRLVM